MWITSLWYSFCPFGLLVHFRHFENAVAFSSDRTGTFSKSVLMRKTIVINTLLILGYYLVLQLLIWISMILR